MKDSINLKTLSRDLALQNTKIVNQDNGIVYLSTTNNENKTVDSNFSSFKPTLTKEPEVKKNILIKSNNQKPILNAKNIIKRYLLTFFVFIILSHPEFDMIVNIDEMNTIYLVFLKALVFTIIQIILNNTL